MFRKIVLPAGLQLPQGGLPPRPEPHSWACPLSLFFSMGMALPAIVHRATVAILIVFAVRPRPALSSFQRAGEGYPGPSGRHQAREGASGRGRAIMDEENCTESFGNL
ncbi:MAG: hypothetical protein ACP5OU_04625 [Methanothrix sp.]